MSSLAKIEANRRNGAKSKGPITQEGKARSALNARTHGFCGERVVLTTEDQPLFDRMHQEFTNLYNPLSVVEEQYLLEMVWNRWRLHRLWNAEDAYIETELGKPVNNQGKPPNVATGLLVADLTRTGEALDTLPRYELRLNRLFNKSKENLLEAQELRRSRIILDEDPEPDNENEPEPQPMPNEPKPGPHAVEPPRTNEPKPVAVIPIRSNEPNPQPSAETQNEPNWDFCSNI